MAISHSAISRKGLLLGLLLMCLTVFYADARSADRWYTANYQDSKTDRDYQDKKDNKSKKTETRKTKKPDVQPVDPDKQAPQKPEIKQVPKSRKQLKPAVVKPKVKPVRIIRPKIKKH